LKMVFCLQSVPRLYNEDQQPAISWVASGQWQLVVGHEESPLLTAATKQRHDRITNRKLYVCCSCSDL
jgi:hypothetical protein